MCHTYFYSFIGHTVPRARPGPRLIRRLLVLTTGGLNVTWGAHNCDELEDLLESETGGEPEAGKSGTVAAESRSATLNEH